MFFYAFINQAAIDAVFAAGDRLPENEQAWAAGLFSPLETPFQGTDDEAKIRTQLIVGQVLSQLETKKAQQPSQDRAWGVLARFIRYIGAMSRQDKEQMAFYEREFEADLKIYHSEVLPS
jgi:hypothetical protein